MAVLSRRVTSPADTNVRYSCSYTDNYEELLPSFFLSLLTYRYQVLPKRCCPSVILHSAATQKKVIFISTTIQDLDDEMLSRILTIQDFCRVIHAANECT
jgi:hypothetical protein